MLATVTLMLEYEVNDLLSSNSTPIARGRCS